MAKAVGIDLGTTNSVIATVDGGQADVVPNAEGSRTTPSVVAFTEQGERLVGQLARRQAILNPKGTITSAKRFIGRRYEEVESEAKAVSFDVAPGPDGLARFDVRLLEVGDGVVEVRATAGDTHLGGDDFDRRLVDHLADQFKGEQGIDVRNDPQALQRLFEAAEKAKVELSSVTQTQVNLPFITADANGPKHLNTTLTRATFEQLTADLVERCTGPVRQAMSDAKVTANDID